MLLGEKKKKMSQEKREKKDSKWKMERAKHVKKEERNGH
jgi:hypothetical protein